MFYFWKYFTVSTFLLGLDSNSVIVLVSNVFCCFLSDCWLTIILSNFWCRGPFSLVSVREVSSLVSVSEVFSLVSVREVFSLVSVGEVFSSVSVGEVFYCLFVFQIFLCFCSWDLFQQLLWMHDDSNFCSYCLWDNLLAALIGMWVWHFWEKCQLQITGVINSSQRVAIPWLIVLFSMSWVGDVLDVFSSYCSRYLQGCANSCHHHLTLTGINCCVWISLNPLLAVVVPLLASIFAWNKTWAILSYCLFFTCLPFFGGLLQPLQIDKVTVSSFRVQ